MKILKPYLFFILIVGLLVSCNKETIEDPLPTQNPVFHADGMIGSESFSVAAGNNNFYMQTFGELIKGVNFYAGKLGDGDFELEVGIYNGNLDYANISAAEGIPSVINFALMPSEPLAILSKDLLPNNMFIEEIVWSLNGEYAGVNTVSILHPGKYNVCAEVTFTDGSSETLCNEMILGYTKHAVGQIRHFLGQNGSLQVWVEADQVPVSSVKWFMDGVYQLEDIKFNTSVDQESHVIKAEITFQNGVKRTKSILIDGSLSGKFIDDFSVFEISASSISWDYNAQITLRKEGKEYQSLYTQNATSSINVTDVALYGKNSAGNLVYKISGEIACFLKDMDTGEVLPFNCTTVFGVEIK